MTNTHRFKFRACYQLQDIYSKGDIELPFVGKKRDFLLDVKQGNLEFKNISEILDKEINKTFELSSKSSYPNKPNYEKWAGFVKDVYINKIKE